MSTDKRIEEAVAAGEKNKRTATFVHNWCAHVKIKRSGGVGMVEMQTGLPIGHHSLECPHAVAGRMATWDLADAAIDFHDRNCVNCKHRKPVGLPNISQLVAAREKAKAEREQENRRHEAERASALAARDAKREKIRQRLTPVQATILDQLQQLDHTPTEAGTHTLVETAKVAPEHFTKEIQEHLFDLLDVGRHYSTESCLSVLDILNADRERLCDAALVALRRYDAIDVAASIVQKLVEFADGALVSGALPALIDRANPRDYPIIGGTRRQPLKEPLHAAYRRRPQNVENAVQEMLDGKSIDDVEQAARGINSIAEVNAVFPIKYARSLIAKLVRAKHLLPDVNDYDREPISVIEEAIVAAFQQVPDEIDGILQDFLEGASDDGLAAIINIYDEVLKGLRLSDSAFGGPPITPTKAHEVAFQRLIWFGTTLDGNEARNALQSSFSRDLWALTPLAVTQIDNLLGAAAILDDKYAKIGISPTSGIITQKPKTLEVLELYSTRSYFEGLRSTFVRWACQAAASAGPHAVESVLAFFEKLPEERQEFRCSLIGSLPELVKGGETLNAVLPALYTAMVGDSQLLRSTAATSLGEIAGKHRDKIPDLVFETFAPLLTDNYVIVHKAAGRALRRFSLPEALDGQVGRALLSLITIYDTNREDDRFLLDCLELFANRYELSDFTENLQGFFIRLLMSADPSEVSRDIRFWGRRLLSHRGYPQLLLTLLSDGNSIQYRGDDIFEQLSELPIESMQHGASLIEQFAIQHPRLHGGRIGVIIEALSQSGCWDRATNVAHNAYQQIEDTTWHKQEKLSSALRLVACQYEQAVHGGDGAQLIGLAERWRQTVKEREVDLEAHKKQRDPLRGLLG